MAAQPVLFVSHGSPMLALAPDTEPYGVGLKQVAARLGELPKAVLVVSAHWQAEGPTITSSAHPGVLYDFSGFPDALSALEYPAPGAPALAARFGGRLQAAGWHPVLDPLRPLDHGAWAVLRHLFPAAQVPVVQVSLPAAEPRALKTLGAALRPFREEGILILASGGLIHNLRAVDFSSSDPQGEPWAVAAETWFLERLASAAWEDLFQHRERWPASHQAAPTTEHLDPLFVAAGAAHPHEPPETLFAGWQLGNLSLRCLGWGVPGPVD